ncbi:MAG: ankyrin repeat domain-containing protein, partial [Candidatus Anstonellales archaeon]
YSRIIRNGHKEEINNCLTFLANLNNYVYSSRSMYQIYRKLKLISRDKEVTRLFDESRQINGATSIVEIKKHELFNSILRKFYLLYDLDNQKDNEKNIKYIIKIFEVLYCSPWFYSNLFLAEKIHNKYLFYEIYRDNDLISFVHEAILLRNSLALKFLLNIGFAVTGNKVLKEISAKRYFSLPPLHLACKLGNTQAIDILLAHGALAFVSTVDNVYPIHLAAESGKIRAIKILLSQGAFLGVRDDEGKTPYDYAKRKGHEKICRFIINCARNL